MKNQDQKIKVLKGSYQQNTNGENTFREYVELEAQSDPNFFRWLFDCPFERDFDTSLNEDQEIEYKEFLNTL